MQQPFREDARRSPDATFESFDVQISPRGRNLFHYHDDCELVVIRSGNGLRFVGDSIEEYGAGDVVLLGRHLPHTWSPTRGFDSGGRADVLQFDPAALTLAEFDDLHELLDLATTGLAFPAGTAERLGDRWMHHRHGISGTPAVAAALEALSCLVASVGAARSLCSAAFPLADYRSGRRLEAVRRIDHIRDLIRQRLHEPLVQAEVADEAGMNAAAFCRFFRHQTGRTFTRYVQELRVKEASQLLSHTDLKISTIATQVGFGTLAHFNRCFKRETGLTPSEWRSQRSLPAPNPEAV